MSVLRMRKVYLVALLQEREALMNALYGASVFHISELSHKSFNDHEKIAECEKKLQEIEEALLFLKKFAGSPVAIPPKAIDAEDLLLRVTIIRKDCAHLEENIAALSKQLQIFSPFGEFVEDRSSLLQAGILLSLAMLNDEEINILVEKKVEFHLINRINQINYVAIFTTTKAASARLLVKLIDPPAKPLRILRNDLESATHRYTKLKIESECWSYQVLTLEALKEKTKAHFDCLTEMKKARSDDDLFSLFGYVKERDLHRLEKAVADLSVVMSFEEPNQKDQVPVMLENPKTLRGFEVIQKAFTGVSYFEKDKTMLTAFLFVFFGSLCLLDAGYGFLLFLLGYLVAIKKNRDFGQVFMWTGGVSLVLGLFCGQVFGLVFAEDIVKNIPPVMSLATDPMVCFRFSLLAGMFAIMLSNLTAIVEKGFFTHHTGNFFMMLGGFCYVLKEKGFLNGQFYDSSTMLFFIACLFFSLSIIAWVLVPEPIFGDHKTYANILWMFYSGPLGLVQDILSHMRLFGIALSGSILALVINKIATLLPVFLGAIFVPIGHVAVFLLSLLSLYIHASRLIFLEFGSKCMSGGHHYFRPFSRR